MHFNSDKFYLQEKYSRKVHTKEKSNIFTETLYFKNKT